MHIVQFFERQYVRARDWEIGSERERKNRRFLRGHVGDDEEDDRSDLSFIICNGGCHGETKALCTYLEYFVDIIPEMVIQVSRNGHTGLSRAQ